MINTSGYRLMWMIVMFDLPTHDSKDRKRASNFRNFLLDNGFEMSQFSVYTKFIGRREKTQPMVRKIKAHTPPGKVSILFFTDKQFSDIISIYNNKTEQLAEIPEQTMLF